MTAPNINPNMAGGEAQDGFDVAAIAAQLMRQYDAADQYTQQLRGIQTAAFQYYEADIVTFPAREGGCHQR